MSKEYTIYHIPGKKIGVTNDLYNRVERQQGYEVGEYEILDSLLIYFIYYIIIQM